MQIEIQHGFRSIIWISLFPVVIQTLKRGRPLNVTAQIKNICQFSISRDDIHSSAAAA
jgi:hypothetical protein